MADKFDPYHKWLGIAPKDQPPHHYRLLGVDLFERDPEVVEAAASRQLSYVQSCATGEHVALSQNLMNQITQARLTLLSAGKREAYDKELKAKLATTTSDVASVTPLESAPLSMARLLEEDLFAASAVISPADSIGPAVPIRVVEPEVSVVQPSAQGASDDSAFELKKKKSSSKSAVAARAAGSAYGTAPGRAKVKVNWRFPVFLALAAGLLVCGIIVAQKVPQWIEELSGDSSAKDVIAKSDLDPTTEVGAGDVENVDVADVVDEPGDSADNRDAADDPDARDADVRADGERTPDASEPQPKDTGEDKGEDKGEDTGEDTGEDVAAPSLVRRQPDGPDPLAGPLQPEDLPDEVFRNEDDAPQADPNTQGADPDANDVGLPGEGVLPDVDDPVENGAQDPSDGEAATGDAAATDDVIEMQPVPDESMRQDAQEQVKREYRMARARPEDRKIMAETMIDHARIASDSPALQYVLFEEASDVAIEAGDAELAIEALKQLGRRFSTDVYLLQVLSLRKFSSMPPAAASPAGQALKQLLTQFVEEAFKAGRTDVVSEALKAMTTLAMRWRDDELRELADEYRAKLQEM